jgi:hypothetical protein
MLKHSYGVLTHKILLLRRLEELQKTQGITMMELNLWKGLNYTTPQMVLFTLSHGVNHARIGYLSGFKINCKF